MRGNSPTLRLVTFSLLACGAACTLRASQDLDGDQVADPIEVKTSSTWRGVTHIELRIALSARRQVRLLELDSSAFGLRIQLRDVNGDQDNDLVLRDWADRVIAVFLNAGNGEFLLAPDPHVYPLEVPFSPANLVSQCPSKRQMVGASSPNPVALSRPVETDLRAEESLLRGNDVEYLPPRAEFARSRAPPNGRS